MEKWSGVVHKYALLYLFMHIYISKNLFPTISIEPLFGLLIELSTYRLSNLSLNISDNRYQPWKTNYRTIGIDPR
jgi:hypothetical protein